MNRRLLQEKSERVKAKKGHYPLLLFEDEGDNEMSEEC
jgi:hypothetical protein